jgi:hypothetical protein
MPFRIKDLMIAVLPVREEENPLLGCLMSPCPDMPGSIFAGDCTRCTDLGSCDAGCTRIQCSYQTNDLVAALVDLRDAELQLLRAELRLAQQGLERRRSPQEIDFLERHLQEALEELRSQRDRLTRETNVEPESK